MLTTERTRTHGKDSKGMCEISLDTLSTNKSSRSSLEREVLELPRPAEKASFNFRVNLHGPKTKNN